MESLGKRVSVSGTALTRDSGPVVFGESGTNAQHSFMQRLHQGITPIPADFVLVARPDHDHAESHRILLANALAQAEARAAMQATGMDAAEIDRLALHRTCPGDRPSVTMVLPALTPHSLVALIALYEHKVACLGAF